MPTVPNSGVKRLGSLMAILCLLALGGCVTKWIKPGGTVAEFEGMKSSCSARAYGRYPPLLVQTEIRPAYTTPVQTQCYGAGYNVQCTTTGGETVAPEFVMVDQNDSIRDEDIQSCFYENGWTPQQ